MKKLTITFLALLITMPALAQEGQSYITYDDGDSVLLQSDGREVDARVNLPVYPGDELRAGKRGRTEIRLADGNVVSIDRYSRLKFESILASFETDDAQTVARLLDGQTIIYRLHKGSEPLRLDTANASYLASKESLYGVEVNSKGIDLVTVFEGAIEVRTREGVTTLSAGERVKVDVTGIYSRTQLVKNGATEFEQWFIRRANRYASNESRYLDSSLSYVEQDLNENGRWIFVSEYSGYVWSPYVSVGWRPYYNGYWHVGWGGSMVWVSYEPWGWAPYHYGRWAHHPYHGWVWLPGYGYSPAWVYWVWGPSWVGWAPAGWYDCYWGYRPWYYYPNHYRHASYYRGYGFQGRVTVSTKDLNAYTVVDRGVLFSNRVDRASLTADEVRTRLARDGNTGVLSNQGVRVRDDEMRDPSRLADRIIRGGSGSGTGNSQGTGSPADVTQFFQRDPNPSASVRDRVTRGVPRDAETTQTTRGTSAGGATVPDTSSSDPGVVTRGTTGRGGGTSAGGTVTRGGTGQTVTRPIPATGTRSDGGATGSSTTSEPRGGVVRPRTDSPGTDSDTGNTQGTSVRPRGVTRPATTEPTPDSRGNGNSETTKPRTVTRPEPAKPTETSTTPKNDSGEGTRTQSRPVRPSIRDGDQPVSRAPVKSSSTSSNDDWRRGNAGSKDPAQRVITTIGGARISSSSPDQSTSNAGTRTTTRSTDSSSTSWRTRGSFTSGSTSTGKTPTATRSSSGTTSRGSSGVSRPPTRSGSTGSKTAKPSSTGSGSSPSTRSSGTKPSSGGRAGISRPSSGGSKSSSSGSKSSGKVTRNPN